MKDSFKLLDQGHMPTSNVLWLQRTVLKIFYVLYLTANADLSFNNIGKDSYKKHTFPVYQTRILSLGESDV